VLVLETLLWPDEVREPDFPFLDQDLDVRSQELKMASSLIESMTEEFDPDAHHDSYREALAELVAAKAEGRDVVQPAEAAAKSEPTSLADALKASIAAAKGSSAKPSSAKGGPAKGGPAKGGSARGSSASRSRRRASA
jgi:DNA end-binding protein Ku